jgi:hypothetical protein
MWFGYFCALMIFGKEEKFIAAFTKSLNYAPREDRLNMLPIETEHSYQRNQGEKVGGSCLQH